MRPREAGRDRAQQGAEAAMTATEPEADEGTRRMRRAVVALLAARQRLWHETFPGLHRRAQPQIINYLGTRGRAGATVGELHGLVRQIFLLDDSTVKERLQEIARLGLCRLDPPGEGLSTRTVIVPESELLDRFERFLQVLAETCAATAAALDPLVPAMAPGGLDPAGRTQVLRALDGMAEAWRTALEQIFDAAGLSPARRAEAMRHLNATSHAALLQMAVEHHVGASALDDGREGLLADRMAAALLTLTGQNFQTTRDHIAFLMDLGLLSRQAGRALRVALAETVAPPLEAALAATAALLPQLARDIAGGADGADHAAAPPAPVTAADEDALLTMRRSAPHRMLHELVVEAPGHPARRAAIPAAGLTIGRMPPCDLVLPAGDVSRQHCRLAVIEGAAMLTDLNSTNGTRVDGERIIGSVRLAPGAVVLVGACRLTYELRPSEDEVPADLPTERTMRVRPV